jgi:predicted amidohydrolase YtcJ
MAYTHHAAYAEFQETVKGQLQVGQWADVVLLSTDIFRLPADSVDQVTVRLTICDGRVVYES